MVVDELNAPGRASSSHVRMTQSLTVDSTAPALRLLNVALRPTPKVLESLAKLKMPESSGVIDSPNGADWSSWPLTPALKTMPSLSSGRAVLMLTVAPIPPEAMSARAVLYTSTALTASDDRFAKLKERPCAPWPPVTASPAPNAS